MPCPGDPGPRPSFLPTNNVAKAVLRYILFGQTVENVHYFQRSGGYDVASLTTLAGQIKDSWSHFLKPQLGPQIELIDITVTDQSVVSGAQAISVVNLAGTSGNACFPAPNATWAVKFATGLSGRSNRGRMYVPSLQDTGVVGGSLVALYATTLLTAIGNFFGEIFSTTGDLHVIVSYQNDCEWRTAGNFVPVTTYTAVDLAVDSQRRRLPGRGI